MLEDGADIIDVGGVSTKPGMSLIAADDEWKRVRPFLQALITEFPNTVFSIDTYNSLTAEKCVENGFAIINDISGGRFDDKMFETVAHLQVPYILMHSIETPETMQNNPQYNDVVQEVYKYFSEKINLLHQKGVNDIIIDLGFGFGKSVEHNYQLLKSLDLFAQLGKPILCGMSRKSMINKVLNINALDALNGTTVLNTIALLNGCNILRVHDVKQATEAVKLVKAYRD
jgi:dihydropteroate synthase